MLVDACLWRYRRRGRRSWTGMRSRPLHCLGGWRPVAQRRVRPDSLVVLAPPFDDNPGLLQRVEDLAVEQLVAKLRVEALAIAVLPGTAGHDVGRAGPDSGNPLAHRLCNELRAVVGTNVAGHAAQDEQVRERVDHVDGFQLATDPDRQAFPGELVDDVGANAKRLSRAFGSSFRCGCGPERSRRTRHGWDVPGEAGCRSSRCTRAARAWAACAEPSAPRVARSARPACGSRPSRLDAASP